MQLFLPQMANYQGGLPSQSTVPQPEFHTPPFSFVLNTKRNLIPFPSILRINSLLLLTLALTISPLISIDLKKSFMFNTMFLYYDIENIHSDACKYVSYMHCILYLRPYSSFSSILQRRKWHPL